RARRPRSRRPWRLRPPTAGSRDKAAARLEPVTRSQPTLPTPGRPVRANRACRTGRAGPSGPPGPRAGLARGRSHAETTPSSPPGRRGVGRFARFALNDGGELRGGLHLIPSLDLAGEATDPTEPLCVNSDIEHLAGSNRRAELRLLDPHEQADVKLGVEGAD